MIKLTQLPNMRAYFMYLTIKMNKNGKKSEKYEKNA